LSYYSDESDSSENEVIHIRGSSTRPSAVKNNAISVPPKVP